MPSPRPSQGQDGAGRSAKRRRVRADVSLTPELFSDEEKAEYLSPPVRRETASDPQEPSVEGGVSKQGLKFVLGILLVPAAIILSGAFLGTLKASVRDGLLAQRSFGCLAAGMVVFAILFALLPRRILMLPYVFGHEVTHALWVKLFGGKVADRFHVSLEGGHVLTDRVNTWIVLAPYFFPIYSFFAATIYGVLLATGKVLDLLHGEGTLCGEIASFQWVFLLVIGCTLAFHLVFTFLLVTKSQPDLHYGGNFFSLMVIYLINLLIVTGLLLGTSNKGLWGIYFGRLGDTAVLLFEGCGRLWEWSEAMIVWVRAAFAK